MMEIQVALRVVRGPDWRWGDQDGGVGGVGTVAEVTGGEVSSGDSTVAGKAVVVQWDTGNRCNYRCGLEGKYDLKVFDSAPTGYVHEHIICDSCREQNIAGIRWKCSRCYDFDLCSKCYHAGKHSLEHQFSRIDKINTKSVRVSARSSTSKTAAKGVFPNAEVLRGHDWIWGDQDGGLGKSGKALEIKNWGNETFRSVVEVEWRETGKKNVYRLGHKGKVDLKCKQPSNECYFYPEHLPILGAPNEEPSTPTSPTVVTQTFASGDRVKIQLEVEVFKMMQDGHGGWNDGMASCLSEVGSVVTVLDSGDLRVRFPNNQLWTLNSDAVVKVNGDETVISSSVDHFQQGDVVRVLDDIAKVHNLQENHGGWVDDMALSLGQVGRIVRVFPTGDLRIAVNGRTWTFNSQCLVPAPGENPPDAPAGELESEDIGLHLKLLSLLENPAVIVAAAAAGDVGTLRDFLSKHPHEVNSKAAGKAAIHCATVAGNIPVLKAILEFSPDLEVEDEDGDRPLHLCAYSDEDEAAQLLIDAGANVNTKNHRGATPLIIAAVKGHHSVLRKLGNNPNIRVDEQDSDGDTALHCAVLAQKNESVSSLLECGADPTLLNFRLFTPIHEAARVGFLPAVEQFIRKYPGHVDLRKDDGYTALHLASLNDHLDVVTTLADLDFCEINAKTNSGQTALHLAVHQGHTRITERLVGFGINLNIQDSDGDTALHMAMNRGTVDTLSSDTPQLRKICDSLGSEGSTAVVSCFLVREGADTYLTNDKGLTPLRIGSPVVAALVTNFIGQTGGSLFHGSLRALPPLAPLQAPVASSIGATTLHMQGVFAKPMAVGSGNPPSVQQPLAQQALAAQPPPAVTRAPKELCFLCESPIDIKFEPCGHSVLCAECGGRAKKCTTCKQPVKTISKLKLTCPMCNEEEASVIVRPCGHEFCPGCARRMKLCFECRTPILAKEGLPAEPSQATTEAPSEQTPCSICLTEPRNTAFLCGHQLCWECAQKVDHCPVCRKFVTHRIRLFQ